MDHRCARGGTASPGPYRAQLLAIPLLGLALAGCEGSPSSLAPKGPGTGETAFLSWVLFVTGGVIYIGVMGLLAYALVRKREGETDFEPGPLDENRMIWLGGILLPLVVISAMVLFNLRSQARLAAAEPQSTITIHVSGEQWWWDVTYVDYQIRTANEIHIPVGEPVELILTGKDVIHSFWVPELHGKRDMIPGRTNTFWLQADEPGEYLGLCTEYCGLQHARMQFLVIAQPADEFEAWLAHQQQPAETPGSPLAQRGQEVFLSSHCVNCHMIRGTGATGILGPDLTHLASRRTIGANTVENNRGNLGGWVLHPDSIKPGVKMPPIKLQSEELHALLAYLESLQ